MADAPKAKPAAVREKTVDEKRDAPEPRREAARFVPGGEVHWFTGERIAREGRENR